MYIKFDALYTAVGHINFYMHVYNIQEVCLLRSHAPSWVAACMLLQSGNGR